MCTAAAGSDRLQRCHIIGFTTREDTCDRPVLTKEKKAMSEPFLGQIILVPYNFAPRGWAFCNGQLLSIAQNTALFSLLGTTYGGNGQTTFALPDLRGRVPISSGQSPGLQNYDLGQVGGAESQTLTASQMPMHNHSVQALTDAVTTSSPTSNFLGTAPRGANLYAPPSANTTQMSPQMIAAAGGSQPFDIRDPYLTLNYCIALEGVFPSRS
jgi:microcystin-dependent protein